MNKIEPMTIEEIKELNGELIDPRRLILAWAEAEARARRVEKLESLAPLGHTGSCGPEMGCDALCSDWFYACTNDYLAEVLLEIGWRI